MIMLKKMYNDIKDSIELIKKSIKANRKKIDAIKKHMILNLYHK